MERSAAVEDYLKALWHRAASGEPVTSAAVAASLGVTAPSVSAMLKRLEAAGLVERGPGHGLLLTPAGEALARAVVRRHRLLETFLAEVLDVPWDEVHAEAELLEHVLSPRLEERIDRLLGHPRRDPHGDPIPPARGRHEEVWGEPLPAAVEGARFRVDRVSDRDPGALRHLAELEIRPGVELLVEERVPFGGGALWVRVAGLRRLVGGEAAAVVHGTTVPPAAPPAPDLAAPSSPDTVLPPVGEAAPRLREGV